jgi:Rad3-related DNA helicase
MIAKIIEICKSHESDSGVIHTGSFQIANWLVNELTDKIPHKIVHHNPDSDFTRDEVINEFMANDNAVPTILISPSITEGLDLKEDKGRFSIIAKVPFPYLGDSWVKRRMELSKEWYSRQAMIGIIQATGRVVRSKEDWGYNYILDESFGMLSKMYSKNIPKWFKDSIL